MTYKAALVHFIGQGGYFFERIVHNIDSDIF